MRAAVAGVAARDIGLVRRGIRVLRSRLDRLDRVLQGGLRVRAGLQRRVQLARQVVEVLHSDEIILFPCRQIVVCCTFHVNLPFLAAKIKIGRR